MIKNVTNEVKNLKKKVLNRKALAKKLKSLGLLTGEGIPVS